MIEDAAIFVAGLFVGAFSLACLIGWMGVEAIKRMVLGE